MKVFSDISEESNEKVCLIGLYPLVRIVDSKQFYGVYHKDEKLWLVIDKLSFRVIETLTGDSEDIRDKTVEYEEDESLENSFVYMTDTSTDYMKHCDLDLRLDTIREKIISVVENFEVDVQENKDDTLNDYPIVDGREDVKAELYRYENYVLRHFKSRYFEKVVEIISNERDKKYICVNDIAIDYEMCPISPVLKFAGETISMSKKTAYPSVTLECKDVEQAEWCYIGLLDEIMLKYGRKTGSLDELKIVDDITVVKNSLKDAFAESVDSIIGSCTFLNS